MDKDVILVLVEGISEEAAFGYMFEEEFEEKTDEYVVEFHPVHGDITADKGSDPRNIEEKINETVEEFLDRPDKHYNKKNIGMIVQLCDTDGAFVKDDFVEEKNVDGPIYYLDKISCSNPEKIKSRNDRKSTLLKYLSSTPNMTNKNINYKIYFLSCNLEHLIQNDQNVNADNKTEIAHEFASEHGDFEAFLNFMQDKCLKVEGDYEETWDFITENCNSLKRFTNLNLLFEEKKE